MWWRGLRTGYDCGHCWLSDDWGSLCGHLLQSLAGPWSSSFGGVRLTGDSSKKTSGHQGQPQIGSEVLMNEGQKSKQPGWLC